MKESRESKGGFLLASGNSSRRKSATYLFKYLLCCNFLQYLEAGAVPALLLQLASAFNMSTGQQGLLGGIVYLSLSLGGPFAGYILRRFDHKTVVFSALCINTLFTAAWALTPTNLTHSGGIFISIRFLMGLSQCVLCVFLPLWANEHAPRGKRTGYMGRLQASVPFGVMAGYILASVVLTLSKGSDTCGPVLCWRIPFLVEVLLTIPFCVALHFVPAEHISLRVVHSTTRKVMRRTSSNSQLLQMYKDTSGGGGGDSMAGSSPGNNQIGIINTPRKETTLIVTAINSEYVLSSGSCAYNAGGAISPLHLIGFAPAIDAANIMSSTRRDGSSGSRDNDSFSGSLNNDDVDTNDNDTTGTARGSAAAFNDMSSSGGESQHGGVAIDVADTALTSDADAPLHNAVLSASSSREASEGEDDVRDKSPMVTSRRARSENSRLRQQSVSASIFSAVSARDIIRKSSDDLRSLHSSDDLISMLPGIQYDGSRMESRRSPGRHRSVVDTEGADSIMLLSATEPCGKSMPSPLKNAATNNGSLRDDEADNDGSAVAASPIDISRISPLHPPDPDPRFNQTTSLLAKNRASGEGIYGSVQSVASSSINRLRPGAKAVTGYESLREAMRGTSIQRPRRQDKASSGAAARYSGIERSAQRGGGADLGGSSPACDVSTMYGSRQSRLESSSLGADSALDPNNNTMVVNLSTSNYIMESDSSGSSGSDEDEFFSPTKSSSHTGVSIDNVGATDSSASRSMASSAATLLRIPVYRYILGAMAALYFTVTGVQFWGTSYLHVALNAPLPLVNTLFILCAATGPTLGVFFGGWLVDFCGGYRGVKQRTAALEICCLFGIVGCVFSIPITFLDNIVSVVVLLWIVLFSGAAILPACSGILVSIVPRKHRAVSSSLSLVVFNLFGYCLSLLLSGYLMQWLKHVNINCGMGCELTWGFRLVLFWCNFSLVFLVLALVASYAERERRDRKRLSYILDAVP